MRRTILAAVIACATALGATSDASGAQELPLFLKPYYAPLFTLDGVELQAAGHTEQSNVSHYVFSTPDQVVNLAVDSFTCNSDLCRTVYENALRYTNEQAKAGNGRFRKVTDSEFRAEWKSGLGDNYLLVLRHPSSVQFWTYTTRLTRTLPIETTFEKIEFLANRQRYEDARIAGNVELGRWDRQIHDYERSLLKDGKKADALVVLRELIQTSPFDFQAQMDFVANTPDKTAAKDSATAVYENAESPELVAKAAQYINITIHDASSLPLLERNGRGLQVMLIPLGTADVRLVTDAGKVFQSITNIPVKVRRMNDSFTFGTPNRLFNEKAIQQVIVQKEGPTVDFSRWNAQRYGLELMRTVADADPLAKFQMQTFVDGLEGRPGQYMVDAYLDRLGNYLMPYRSDDKRTIYVGVTDANIYSGDVNFVFSSAKLGSGTYVSILSYAMMTAKASGESYESRKRLVERLAKEMVPATLKALDIPRPVDPTDPYSYSNGIQRLNEKSLTLSRPTKDALDKFR